MNCNHTGPLGGVGPCQLSLGHSGDHQVEPRVTWTNYPVATLLGADSDARQQIAVLMARIEKLESKVLFDDDQRTLWAALNIGDYHGQEIRYLNLERIHMKEQNAALTARVEALENQEKLSKQLASSIEYSGQLAEGGLRDNTTRRLKDIMGLAEFWRDALEGRDGLLPNPHSDLPNSPMSPVWPCKQCQVPTTDLAYSLCPSCREAGSGSVWLYRADDPAALEEAKRAAIEHASKNNIFVPVLPDRLPPSPAKVAVALDDAATRRMMGCDMAASPQQCGEQSKMLGTLLCSKPAGHDGPCFPAENPAIEQSARTEGDDLRDFFFPKGK